MKNLILLIIFSLAYSVAHLQSDGMSYQAVIIDKNPQEIPGADISGNYLKETEVTIRFTITNADQNVEFKESQITTTDEFGMVNVIIGQGFTEAESLGEFNEINWDGTPKWLTVELAYNGSEFDELSHQNLLFVPYAYHRNIIATQTLDVDGASTLNSTLNVGDATSLSSTLSVTGETTLADNLYVTGETELSDDLYVAGQTLLDQTLTVNGTSVLNESLSVLNSSPSYLSGTLQVEGETLLGSNLDVNGEGNFADQVVINSVESGGEENLSAYPLIVAGSNQGVAVKVSANTPTSSNNFISFFNGQNDVVGTIEGQVFDDLINNREYQMNLARYAAAGVNAGINIGTAAAGVTLCIGVPPVTCPPSWSEIAVAVANAAFVAADLLIYNNYVLDNLGVSYSTGSADYAEYLEPLNPEEYISEGDVVGIIGGKVTLDLTHASQILVVSTSPALLGNLPEDGDVSNHKKIAFMGQVPVKVFGKVAIGDYLIPSGNNDGIAIAVSKKNIAVNQYDKIIGIAWSASTEGLLISRVNVSMGLNSNDLASIVSQQQSEINKMRSEIQAIRDLLNGNMEDTEVAVSAPDEEIIKDLIEREKDMRVGVYSSYKADETISAEFVKECLGYYIDLMIKEGYNMSEFPGLEQFQNNPEFQAKVIHETIQLYEYGYNHVNK